MKNFLSLFSTAFFALLLLALCSISLSASPPTVKTKMDKSNVKILVIGGLPVAGISALAERIAAKDAAVVIVLKDDDALTVTGAFVPIIANKHFREPLTLVKPTSSETKQKPERRCRSVSLFTANEFYDVPPNDYGFSGQSFANPIRAQP